MFGEGRPEEILVGVIAAVLAFLLALRIRHALRTGEVPLYKKRVNRAAIGDAKFFTVVAVNWIAMMLLAWIAADLIYFQTR